MEGHYSLVGGQPPRNEDQVGTYTHVECADILSTMYGDNWPTNVDEFGGIRSGSEELNVNEVIKGVDVNWRMGRDKRNRSNANRRSAGSRDDKNVIIILSNGDQHEIFSIRQSTCIGNVFNNYAVKCGIPLKSLRFTFKGKMLFLSSVGKKSFKNLNITHLSTINVTYIQETTSEVIAESTVPPAPKLKKSSPNNTHGKKTVKAKSTVILYETEEEEQAKKVHSILLSKIFEEAQPMFKAIREKLYSLTLERKPPKTIKPLTDKKGTYSPTSVNFNPSTFGLGAKAGKTSFTVNVGQVDNLYISSKSSPVRSNSSSQRKSIDLHGCTKDEAIQRLDTALDDWMDTAMKGEYPWVVPVDIICGGGSQVLSETVERWIKEKKTVANAPKRH